MRTVTYRDRVVVISAVAADGDVDLMLPSPPSPRSVELWINGLRVTEFGDELVPGAAHVPVRDVVEGDVITLKYHPAG